MLGSFKRTISLTNLDSGCVSGQIATILIFLMVIVLVMILVTVNLGEVANMALDLSNAADSAVLAITNNLATYATLLWEAMGNSYEECTLTLGWLNAIIMIVCIVVWGPVVGGLIGSVIVGAVNGIAYGSWSAAVSGFLDGLTFTAAVIGGQITGGAIGIGAGAGGVLGMASMTTNWVMRDQMKVEAIKEAAHQLNGLAQEDVMTQTAVYTAFLGTVADPNMIQDYFDSDANGDNQEMIPYFQLWWERRTEQLRGKYITPGITQAILNFKNAIIPLISYLDTAVANNGLFSRQEIETSDGPLVALLRTIQNKPPLPPDPFINFWYRGPGNAPYQCWTNPPDGCCPTCDEDDPKDCPACCCPTCDSGSCDCCPGLCSGGSPAYPNGCFDEVDKTIERLKKLNDELKSIRDRDVSLLANTWYIWLSVFYNSSTDTDYYDSLQKLTQAIGPVTAQGTWQYNIERKRQSLLACISGCGGSCVTNPPCRGPVGALPASFGTINADLTDEFADVQNRLSNLINMVNTFRAACNALYVAIEAAKPPSDSLNTVGIWVDSLGATHYIDYGGDGKAGPAVYWWCDSSGYHEIRVTVNYKMPSIGTSSSAFKTCTEVENWCGTPTVTITRLEPKSNIGLLGPFNPLLGPSVLTRVREPSSPVIPYPSLIAERCKNCQDTKWCSADMFSVQKTGTGCYCGGETRRWASQINYGDCSGHLR